MAVVLSSGGFSVAGSQTAPPCPPATQPAVLGGARGPYTRSLGVSKRQAEMRGGGGGDDGGGGRGWWGEAVEGGLFSHQFVNKRNYSEQTHSTHPQPESSWSKAYFEFIWCAIHYLLKRRKMISIAQSFYT